MGNRGLHFLFRRVRILSAATVGLATVAACANGPGAANDPVGDRERSPLKFNLLAHADPRRVTVEVTGQAAGSVPEAMTVGEGVVAGVAAAGGGAGMYALLGPTVYVGGAAGPTGLLAGAIALPVLILAGIQESADRKALVTAFAEMDVPVRLKESIEAELGRAAEHKPEQSLNEPVSLVLPIQSIGFVKAPNGGLCFHFMSGLEVIRQENVIFSDRLYWTHEKRNDDMPPARCESLSGLTNDDARLARAILAEANAVIAAVVAKRLEFFRQ